VVAPPKFAAYGYDRGFGTWESPEPHPDITARNWIWSPDDKVKRWDRTRWMVDESLAFMKAHPNQPCFVNLWLDDTHAPWVPTAEDQDAGPGGRGKGKGETLARLGKVLVEMDRQIGRLLDSLRDPKADRPTVVLFLGDNGPLPTFNQTRAGGLRGSKMSLYEGGIRVPLIAWGPGIVPAGVTNDTTVFTGVDFLPTLAGLCSARLPADAHPDGEDLSRSLRGDTPVRTKPVYWEYGRNETAFGYPQEARHRSPACAVRDGNWKLLTNADGSKAELYDVAGDRNETKNLAGDRPDVAKRLSEMLLSWRKSLP
jgi:arylsulfatase A-like enzyme